MNLASILQKPAVLRSALCAASLAMCTAQALAGPPNYNPPSGPQVQVGGGQSVAPSPWTPTPTTNDSPQQNQSALFAAPRNSGSSSGQTTPTWEHAQSTPNQFVYKCTSKEKTTFQDTPCDKANSALYWPGTGRPTPNY